MIGYKKTPNAKPIINITVDEGLLEMIENYRFENRLSSRSEAFSKLVQLGFNYVSNKEFKEISFSNALKCLKEGETVWLSMGGEMKIPINYDYTMSENHLESLSLEAVFQGKWYKKISL